ncbi:MAG TPA: alpha/beta hydrolase [Pyrinomonadaceae bacterium]|nr:alpha/beta hydrolase [Pyrinomonadaceae bacterium]
MLQPIESGLSKGGLHYAIYGTGKPLLAIHGLGACVYTWREFVRTADVFPGYQIILVDLKGCGESLKPHDNNYSILTQRDLVYEFLEERGLRDLTLVGNSYGGGVSLLLTLKLCANERGRLAKLILIDSAAYNKLLPLHVKLLRVPLIGWLGVHLLSPRNQVKKVLDACYYDHAKISEESITEYSRPIAAPGGRYALLKIGQQAIPKNFDELTQQYPKLKVPTLIIWGVNDKIIPPVIGEMLHAAVGGSRLELINNCGHMPQEEKPEETIKLMREFLGIQ